MPPLIVTAAIIVRDGRVLVTRRRPDVPYPDLWEFPGGKMEPGEDPRDCLIRELREELGIGIEVQEVFDVTYYRYPERPVLILSYRCRWCDGTIQDLEVAEHKWVPPRSLRSDEMLPADAPLLTRLVEELADADTSDV